MHDPEVIKEPPAELVLPARPERRISIGSAMLMAAALSMPGVAHMERRVNRGAKRIDRGRCSGCGKKPFDCRCRGKA